MLEGATQTAVICNCLNVIFVVSVFRHAQLFIRDPGDREYAYLVCMSINIVLVQPILRTHAPTPSTTATELDLVISIIKSSVDDACGHSLVKDNGCIRTLS